MDECVGDMTPPSSTNAGTVILRSGKWVAKIRHPIRKVWVCLGIYNNHEEASDAYTRKKLEYESHSVQETDASFNTNVADLEKRTGVKRTTSGKWGANIIHKKVSVWLGSYNTLNEAADAYEMSKLELQSPKVGSLTKANSSVGSDSRLENDYSTAEDSQEVLNQKKCELGMNGDAEQSERNQRRRHAYVRKSGRWQTEIMHPMKKRKMIHLGTFDTAEEAEDAYKSTRRRFELMFPGYINCKQSNESVQLGTLTEEAEEAYNNKMREVDLIVSVHKKPKQSKVNLIAEGTSDDPFVCTNGSSVIKADREEDADAGGSIINVNVESVPRFVKEETGEFDLGVIDSCGQLVGEYSTMDDDLWIG